MVSCRLIFWHFAGLPPSSHRLDGGSSFFLIVSFRYHDIIELFNEENTQKQGKIFVYVFFAKTTFLSILKQLYSYFVHVSAPLSIFPSWRSTESYWRSDSIHKRRTFSLDSLVSNGKWENFYYGKHHRKNPKTNTYYCPQ